MFQVNVDLIVTSRTRFDACTGELLGWLHHISMYGMVLLSKPKLCVLAVCQRRSRRKRGKNVIVVLLMRL
jgi:hypothetical protein